MDRSNTNARREEKYLSLGIYFTEHPNTYAYSSLIAVFPCNVVLYGRFYSYTQGFQGFLSALDQGHPWSSDSGSAIIKCVKKYMKCQELFVYTKQLDLMWQEYPFNIDKSILKECPLCIILDVYVYNHCSSQFCDSCKHFRAYASSVFSGCSLSQFSRTIKSMDFVTSQCFRISQMPSVKTRLQ